MTKRRNQWRGFWKLAVLLAFSLACGLTSSPTVAPTSAPAFDPTRAALEFQATTMAMQLTQAALGGGQPVEPDQPTALASATAGAPTLTPEPTAVPATATQDVKALMKTAKILLYEDTALILDPWIREALNGLGLTYTNVDDYLGHFMENLNSGTDWDLIIVGAEWKEAVRGEFWDVINDHINNRNTSVIIEVWYLDLYRDAPLRLLLANCGVQYQSDQGLAESVFWLAPEHPLLNEPNVVEPLIHYSRYWDRQSGDKIKLAGSGDATMLAGLKVNDKSNSGQIAVCNDGRVIVQTFSNHDYHEDQIVPLWQNYVYNALKARFEVEP